MDMAKAVNVLEEMKQKLITLRDVSAQFGEPALAKDYGRQVEAIETVLWEIRSD